MMKKTFFASLFPALMLHCSSAKFDGRGPAPSHEIWSQLLRKNVSADGQVNYKAFIEDSVRLKDYLKLLSDHPPNDKTWTINEQKAYWINAYNAFTVKLIMDYYPVKSIKDIGSSIQIPFVNTPFDIKFISIGKEKMDLNNIEHGQLRKKFDDPRIHFAIVCASKSCPVLLNEAYEPEKLEEQLEKQSIAFINDVQRNVISEGAVQISKIFLWFRGDFTKKENITAFLNRYSKVKVETNAKISYLNYDWDLNE